MDDYLKRASCIFLSSVVYVFPLNALAVEKSGCPIDHMIFEDIATHRQFVAESFSFEPSPSCKHDLECGKRFGKTTITGRLDGTRAYAVFFINNAAPCCMWYSFKGTPNYKRLILHGKKVPLIKFGSEWDTIGQPNPPFENDTGPMAAAKFIPSRCRA